MPAISLTALTASVYWVVNSSEAGKSRTTHPFVPIVESTVRRMQVTGVPGGAESWNVTVEVVVPPPEVSNATQSMPDVGSVAKTHAVHEKNATTSVPAMIHTGRDIVDEPP